MIKLKKLLFEHVEGDLFVNANDHNVSVHTKTGPFGLSTASIDNLGDGRWWVSRVLVAVRNMRGQGIGSKILQRAVQEVLKRDPNAKIIVSPGGYDNNTEQQFNFYKKNGFVPLDGDPDSLIYKGK